MSTIHLDQVGGTNIERINKILAGVPGGTYKAAGSALRRAGDTAKTRAGQFASAQYTISKGTFMSNVSMKTNISGGAGGIASMSIYFSGRVIALKKFKTRATKRAGVHTQVLRNGSASTLSHAFGANIFGTSGIFERIGPSRFPLEQKYGPSAAHMMENDQVVKQMEELIVETFDRRIEHEILRLLSGG